MSCHRSPYVAVVTGAGSGIGRELALACARRGMAVVGADVDAIALAETEAMLRALGVPCLMQRCDVAQAAEVDRLALACNEAFGGVDWLFNNAGVATLGPVWQATESDWAWVLGVNLLGVANGVRAFVPRMLARGTKAHVVNTASAAGLATLAGSGVYSASKHGVVALSECLAHDLAAIDAPIGVSVLCPSLLPSRIHEAGRNRPAALADAAVEPEASKERVRAGMAGSTVTARDAAEATLRVIDDGRFYVLPHAQTGASVEKRMAAILSDFRRTHPETQ
ncbi:MAG TPA: SDR family NAD(P)-dependent oxidoreductase [Burkholderiaceae bacterium]|nr:SDR family NAD(P)-dependent oxidoreductase [Burkholderiaceae bacterium]